MLGAADVVTASAAAALAAETLGAGQSALVMIESPNGSAGTLGDELGATTDSANRVVCASSCVVEDGHLIEQIGIDGNAPTTVIIEEAQWADATSLGRLQRLVSSSESGVLLVLAHRPVEGVDAWGLEQLLTGLGEDAKVLSVALEDRTQPDHTLELDGSALDLLAACSLMTGPVSVQLASEALGLGEENVLRLGSDLSASGLLRESRGGFASTGKTADIVRRHDARTGRIASKLASSLEAGNAPGALVGSLWTQAGNPTRAFPHLAQAASAAAGRNANSEAFRLAQEALTAAADSDSPPEPAALTPLHLISASFLRSAGRTKWAREEIEKAVNHGSSEQRARALQLAAQLADDDQRPQEGEALIAVAEWEAMRSGDDSDLASFLAFRARELHRIGFALEADDVLARAEVLAVGASSDRARYRVMLNKAWIHFDRGEAGKAEIEFARLKDLAEQQEGLDSVADKEAWRARALLASGHPDEAITAIRSARETASTEGVEAPVFLTDLAIAESGPAYGQVTTSLEAAEQALDLVSRQLPAWENTVLAIRAQAHLASGDLAAAEADLSRALELTPTGANGWRWRTRCRALLSEVEARRSDRWSEAEAEDLADQLLQSKLYGWAAEMLCVVAENGSSNSAAEEAMMLALHCGLPLVAARAAHAGGLWEGPETAPVILAIKAIDKHVPAEWADGWRQLPHIAAALDAPEPEQDPDIEATSAALNSALAEAGLSRDSVVLSPAQRRASGLVVARPPARRRSRLGLAAAALGVVALAAGTSFAVTQIGSEPEAVAPDTTSVPQETTTIVELSLEETQIDPPTGVDFFFGLSEHRGGPSRSGFVDVAGPRDVNGFYWTYPTAGAINAGSVAWGRYVYVGSTDGAFYALDQTNGSEVWTLPPEGQISTAPALGEADDGEGAPTITMIVVDDAGIVRGQRADGGGGAAWSTRLGSRIRSSPVVSEGVVFVATEDGGVYGMDVVNGDVLWRYPEDEATSIAAVTADLAYDEGVLYVATESGVLHLLDVRNETPSEICTFDAGSPIAVNPIIVEDIVYVATRGQSIWPLVRGQCEDTPPGRLLVYTTETPVEVAPAVVGDVMYLPEDRFLYAKNLDTGEDVWRPDTVTATRPVSTPPVVTRDAVYFGSEDGFVYAVDSTSGELLWSWDTGLPVRGSPSLVEGAVFIVTGDGTLLAVGE